MAEEKKILTQEELAQDWLRITIERFQKAIKKAGIVSLDDLYNSFEKELRAAGNGSVASALIRFRLHGRFVDMGVGRGVPIGSQARKADYYKYRNKKGQLHKYGRKPKKWYSKTLTGQTKKLGELMSEQFGGKAIQIIENALTHATKDLQINFGNG
jgi:hypothetical protein